VRLEANTLDMEDASIRTDGFVTQGGWPEVDAGDPVHLHDAVRLPVGEALAAGAGVIALRSPAIVRNDRTAMGRGAVAGPGRVARGAVPRPGSRRQRHGHRGRSGPQAAMVRDPCSPG
jgi:hypothetical protein